MKTIQELEKLDRKIMKELYVKSYRWPSGFTKLWLVLAIIFVPAMVCAFACGIVYILYQFIR